MAYRLKLLPAAFKEWEKLAPPILAQFQKKFAERLEAPKVPSARLHGFDEVYKIKLRSGTGLRIRSWTTRSWSSCWPSASGNGVGCSI
ncbi:type II toxin-antitoxin system RelE family toxin [Lamprocystis purpurea]|jgi:mRNA-degrading endonuclease RelE of RelBE toxin-antitoxin system|uniref:type II toxin-antitoxin system RelE family toxin n=1 Tax=Lamprocystis purpurea TaxID=61598 RepID=UPI0003A81602